MRLPPLPKSPGSSGSRGWRRGCSCSLSAPWGWWGTAAPSSSLPGLKIFLLCSFLQFAALWLNINPNYYLLCRFLRYLITFRYIVCFVKKASWVLVFVKQCIFTWSVLPPIIKGDLKEGLQNYVDALFHAILSSRYIPLLIGSSASPILSR